MLADGWHATVLSTQDNANQGVHIPTWIRDDHWRTFCTRLLKDPSSLAGYAPLKVSKDGQVCLACVVGDGVNPTKGNDLQVVCKQGLCGGALRRILALLFGTRERQQFDIATKLLNCGIATAEPYAIVHKKLSSKSWLITRYLQYSIDLDTAVLRELPRMSCAKQHRVKDVLIHHLAELLSLLHKHHISHRDLKASNILVTGMASENIHAGVWLIDTEGIQFRTAGKEPHDRSLIRLIASLVTYRSVTRTDLARLLRQLQKWMIYRRASGNPGFVSYFKRPWPTTNYPAIENLTS